MSETVSREVPGILLVDSITRLGPPHVGTVVVSGSHGGVYAGYCAARGRVRAVIQHDAGIGLDEAGIASLPFLDAIGIAAAVADSASCRIAQAADMWGRGIVSRVNAAAAALGCAPGETVPACAAKLANAIPSSAAVPDIDEARFRIAADPGEPEVWGIDSAALSRPEDARRILVTGSHGGLVGDRPDTRTPDVWAVTYNDAGGCRDASGFGRLPDFDRRGIAAATVAHDTARIGDARSHLATGIVSRVNETARRRGGVAGQSMASFVSAMVRAWKIDGGGA